MGTDWTRWPQCSNSVPNTFELPNQTWNHIPRSIATSLPSCIQWLRQSANPTNIDFDVLGRENMFKLIRTTSMCSGCFNLSPLKHINHLPSTVAQVHKVTWYMLHYGAVTPKRHYMLANSPGIAQLWVDKLRNWAVTKESLKSQGKSKTLVLKYIDKHGCKRWKGSEELRSSESGAYLIPPA